MNKKIAAILVLIACLSVFLTVFQKTPTPPGFNADEAAFGYNAYSLLKTGRDEYGAFLPLRLKSFGDYKMPLYSYLSVPFVGLFGLNEFSTRALNIFLSFLFPFAVYLLALELFKSKRVAVAAAFLSSVSLGLHIISRHAHEAYLAAFLTTITAYFFLRVLRKYDPGSMAAFFTSAVLLLFSYHPGRLFAGMFFAFAAVYAFLKRKHFLFPLLLLVMVGLFSLTDLAYNPSRLKSLAFFNNEGFQLKIAELKTEGGIRYLYNPVFVGAKEILLDHLTYFSPQFLIGNGDENYRFGYPGMSILTPLEYGLFLIGLFYLFKEKERWRWFMVVLLLATPLSASLSWSKGSLTRSLFLLVPVMILASYGAVMLLQEIKRKYRPAVAFFGVALLGFFLVFSWDFYLFHYSKRLIVIHAWQAGYAQVNSYIKENYGKFDKFYITRDIGQPYIFTLFYLQYPPRLYQKQAALTGPDEYGFGQVNGFDKFEFDFKNPAHLKGKSAVIGSIDNFKATIGIDPKRLRTIAVNGEPMFQIYEVK